MKAPQTAASKGRSTRATKIDPAKEELVTKYLPLVRFVAEKIHRRLPPGVDLESLIHSGVVGLLEALDRFDPKRGVEFEVYARYRIQGEVMQCLRSLDWVSRSVRSWGRKMEAARAKLAGQFVREPTAEEMAKELEIPLERYFRFDQQVNDATLLSLDDLAVASEGERDVAHPKFWQNTFLDPLSFVENKELIEKLAAAVDGLPERERVVVTLYYHEEMNLREIAEILSLSEGRICQIFAQTVGHLRGVLGVIVKPKERVSGKRAVTVRKRVEDITVNLQGPLIVNSASLIGIQFVIEEYPVRYALIQADSTK
jgi:RNA polymerase sigma factor FliA